MIAHYTPDPIASHNSTTTYFKLGQMTVESFQRVIHRLDDFP
jgi:hypothetical protein